MRILILGSNGMAGHMINHYLKENTNWEIISWDRSTFEIKDNGAWKKQILDECMSGSVDYIINCIGILKPIANANPILAMKINAVFPHELASIASGVNAKVIHLTTDCWDDEDTYGRSKRAGELDYPNHLSIRSSIIGPELKSDGSGLFQWFMTQKGEVFGFTKHIYDGVTTLELAKQIKFLIENKSELNHIKELRTLKKITKFALLNDIKQAFGKDIKINEKETDVVDKSCSYPDISVETDLSNQVKELKIWMDNHKKIYERYY